MRLTVRTVLSTLGVAFTAYLAVSGLAWRPVPHPMLLIAMLGLYLVVTWLCIFWPARTSVPDATATLTAGLSRRFVLPVWAAAVALLTAAVVPSVAWYAAGPEASLESYATWSLGGISALMAIVMVRRRPWVAWTGVVLLTAAATVWIGLLDALRLGAVGAIVWVGVAQLITWLVDRAARDTAELTEVQRHASEWLASQEGRRRERRVQVWRALTVAGPVLTRTIETGGGLSDEEKLQARLAEGSLRDELRGRGLLDDEVRHRLEAARRRGASVTVLDEGGLDGLDEQALRAIRAELAEILEQAHSDRLYIRTSPHEGVAVTVVGRSCPLDDPDGEESVDLWHEIRQPSAVR